MKTLKSISDILLEGVENAPPEAPEGSPWGKYAFAPNRSNEVPEEPNTEAEENVQQAIYDYLAMNMKDDLADKAKDILSMLNKGYYKSVLDPSQYKFAYRTMEVTPKVFSSIVGVKEDDLKDVALLGAGTLTPFNSPISGWTVDLSLFLSGFESLGRGPGSSIAVVFKAPVQGNKFFGKPGKLAVAAGKPSMAGELEVIGYGPIKYSFCAYAKVNHKNGKSLVDGYKAIIALLKNRE